MKHTVAAMVKISPTGHTDRHVLTEFCGDVLTAARMRRDLVKEIADLKTILDAAQLARAADARAGVRHLAAGLHLVMEHFHGGPLVELLNAAQADIVPLQDEIEKLYRWLNMLYTEER
ncbi:hypothetical protein [Paraburkholderia youngii]|uniref:hypothetical protein n=1 Tax=Paraburkholderia youngii TaxID=2782701 RepID=UPI003D245868